MTAPSSPQQIPSSPPLEDEILPGYTSSREPRVHLSSIPGRDGQPWFTLRLLSDAPVGSKCPMYFNGGSVRGSAAIDLDSAQTIRSVIVEIKSRLCPTTSSKQPPLWHERKILWQAGGGYSPVSIASAGSWKWDFDIPIPRYFDDSPSGGSKTTPLPGSFNLSPYISFLEYYVVVYVKRGKWLPVEHEIHEQFIYTVRERAPSPSPLRELAYSEGYAPPGPAHDPIGWEACSEIIATGVLFGDRKTTTIYKLYLSKPSIYPRGGTIFYRIEVLSDDSQALELMSSPSAISVSLDQEIRASPFKQSVEKTTGNKGIVVEVLPIANGVSWAGSTSGLSDGARIVEGEIRVPSRANLDLAMSVLQLHHFVNFAVGATGFVSANPTLMSIKHPVRIVSHPALGPPPISRVPPGYEAAPVVPRNDTNIIGQGGWYNGWGM